MRFPAGRLVGIVVASAALAATTGCATADHSVQTLATAPRTTAPAICACGGGGGAFGSDPAPTTTVAPPPGLAAFDASGNAICHRYNNLFDGLPDSPQDNPTPAQMAALGRETNLVADLYAKELRELEALPHPASDDTAITKALFLDAQYVPALRRVSQAFTKGDVLGAIGSMTALDTDSIDRALDAIGLNTCDSNGD